MAGPQLVSRVLAEFVGQGRVGDPPQHAALWPSPPPRSLSGGLPGRRLCTPQSTRSAKGGDPTFINALVNGEVAL